ncbi:hypothetical protein [Streptomyces sp. I05A-00742]|uniref:hypothetical protein n=1 Tax=Streptomyces sp. I05A-00742 TaxID=2732853 RepID=UPI001487F93B|nr:hypothetical protein [Streptomyces sp. I05A-00742]
MNTPHPAPATLPQEPPRRGGKRGRTAALAAGVLVVAGAVVGALLWPGGDDGGMEAYTMALPDTVLDGAYKKDTKSDDAKATEDLTDDRTARKMGIANGTAVMGEYVNDKKQDLNVIGVYGDIADPRKTLDAMTAESDKGARKYPAGAPGGKPETVTPWTEYHPAGFDGVIMKCTSSKSEHKTGTASFRFGISQCFWADGSAMGAVQHTVTAFDGLPAEARGATGATGDVMSAEELSVAAAKVRNEARKKK